MGKRLTRIYTRTGDDGTTGLGDGSRLPKDSLRIDAIGLVDTLNSFIGRVLAHANGELRAYVSAASGAQLKGDAGRGAASIPRSIPPPLRPCRRGRSGRA